MGLIKPKPGKKPVERDSLIKSCPYCGGKRSHTRSCLMNQK